MPRYLSARMTTEVGQVGPAVRDDGLTLDPGGPMAPSQGRIGINSSTAVGRGARPACVTR